MGGPSLEPHGDTLSEPGVETCRDTMTVEPVTGDSSDHGVEVEPGAERHGDSARVHKHPDTHPDTTPGIACPSQPSFLSHSCREKARGMARYQLSRAVTCVCIGWTYMTTHLCLLQPLCFSAV